MRSDLEKALAAAYYALINYGALLKKTGKTQNTLQIEALKKVDEQLRILEDARS